MPIGFFGDGSAGVLNTVPRLARCGECGLHKGCQSPKMAPTGRGRQRVLIVAEAPGKQEDREGVQLVGKAGQYMRKILARFGIDLDRDCWKTNALACRPEGNRTPTTLEVEHCRPKVLEAIAAYKPDVIIPLGGPAIQSVIGHIWQDELGPVARWVGWQIPLQEQNCWVCPTWHPSYLLREKDKNAALELFFERHLRAAFELDGRPWERVPDYSKRVEIVLDAEQAAEAIQRINVKGGWVAFDYETDRLKPDAKGSRIVTAAICWNGKRTFAYPWHGPAIEATRELLAGDCKFIASNMKFEQRFTRSILGMRVRHWLWDTMQAAHLLDNREGISGLKFQAFVRFGQPSYDAAVKANFNSKGPNHPNRINRVDLSELLRYNGMDALLEYKLAKLQMKEVSYGEN